MTNGMPELRKISSWRDDPLSLTIELTTSIDIEKEFWLLLNHISEVKPAAYELFARFSIAEELFENTFHRLRAFIRQANNYWEVATKTNFRSSSLLYYYAFLNLVKTFILLKQPNLQDKVSHGIYYGKDQFQNDLIDKCIGVNYGNDQIFYLFYKEIFQIELPKQFKVIELFSYNVEISYQYLQCNFGNINTFPVIHRFSFDKSQKKAWSVLAIPSYVSKPILDSNFIKFDEYFEFVPTPAPADLTFRDIFQFSKTEWAGLDFYQFKESKVVALDSYHSDTAIKYGVVSCLNILKEVFASSLEPNYLPDNNSFYVTIPLTINDQKFPLHEDMAIYLGMFFMSELVRYQPWYLDKVLEDKESWLFRSFVESCPLKFLRMITSRIKNETVVMKWI